MTLASTVSPDLFRARASSSSPALSATSFAPEHVRGDMDGIGRA
jgi:hypothetical protein